MLSKKKWKQYGVPDSKVKGIVIHNTNNTNMNAEELENWLENDNRGNGGCHFLVDYKEVRKVMPVSWSVFNVGNGMQFGNLDCIVIEVCTHYNQEKYNQAEQKAIELIKELIKKYKIKKENIYFHRDFQKDVNCPAQLLERYGNSKTFRRLFKEEK